MALKEPVFEAVEVDETFGPIELVLDDHYLKSYAFAVDDSGFLSDGQPVPAGAIVKELMLVFLSKYDCNKIVGLHQKEEARCHKPVYPGARLTLTGSYIDKYQKRGKGYVVLEAEARDEAGDLVMIQRSTEVMRIPEGVRLGAASASPERRVAGLWPTDCPPAERVRADLAVGTPLAPMEKTVFQDQMSVFSGAEWHRRNIHTSLDVATSAGFPGTIAQGMMEACWTSEYLTRVFGPEWLSNGWYQVVFLNPVFAGDTLTCKGVVCDVRDTDAKREIEVELWFENEDGKMTAAGWGTGKVA